MEYPTGINSIFYRFNINFFILDKYEPTSTSMFNKIQRYIRYLCKDLQHILFVYLALSTNLHLHYTFLPQTLEIENIPTVNKLQCALLNNQSPEDRQYFIQLLIQLLQVAMKDPGFPQSKTVCKISINYCY